MTDELKRFFKSIDFNCDEDVFKNANIKKVIYLKKKDIFEVFIENDKVFPIDIVLSLFKQADLGINKEKKCVVRLEYTNVFEEDVLSYLKYLINEVVDKRPSLVNLKSSKIVIDEDVITLEVSTKLEEAEVKKEGKGICNKLYLYGLGEYDLTSLMNEALNEEVKNELEKSKSQEIEFVPVEPKTPETSSKPINGEVTTINNIMGDTKGIVLEAFIFGIETLERDTINIITLKISDKRNS